MNEYKTTNINNSNKLLLEEIKDLEFKLDKQNKRLNFQKMELNNISELTDSCNEIVNKLKEKMELITKEIDRINNLLIKLKQSGTVYIFWDIENMPIRNNKDATHIVSNIYSEVKKIYINNKIVINCYFEKNKISEKNMIKLNDSGCQLNYIPNPSKKKERADMIIIRDFFDIDSPDIVGLISSDGDFVPYLKKLKDRGVEVFAITKNIRYGEYISDIIKWSSINNKF
jgi:hypothetical protein